MNLLRELNNDNLRVFFSLGNIESLGFEFLWHVARCKTLPLECVILATAI